jgi:hypothetical protein
MKEDYLWDKTGNDIEIEKLENALSQFRYKETSAPAIIPEKILTVEKTPKRKFFSFSFAFAFASCVAFVLILLGVWFQFSNKNVENVNDLSKSITPETKIVLPEKSVETVAPIEEIKIQKPIEKPTFIKAKNSTSPKKNVPPKTIYIARTNKRPKAETLELTEEEKYAYDQLMLALSITSSKLKLVKDKVALNETPEFLIRKDYNKGRN